MQDTSKMYRVWGNWCHEFIRDLQFTGHSTFDHVSLRCFRSTLSYSCTWAVPTLSDVDQLPSIRSHRDLQVGRSTIRDVKIRGRTTDTTRRILLRDHSWSRTLSMTLSDVTKSLSDSMPFHTVGVQVIGGSWMLPSSGACRRTWIWTVQTIHTMSGSIDRGCRSSRIYTLGQRSPFTNVQMSMDNT